MTNDQHHTENGLSGGGSLLDDAPVPEAPRPRREREPAGKTVARWWASMWRTPKARAISSSALAAVLIGASAGAYFTLRPTPKPDYELDELDLVFDFTLLEEEFNNLPVEERIELLSMLWDRMQSMDTSDSVLLATFAASIQGELRDQLERNVSRLFIDATDKYALEYTDVPEEERAEWLEGALVRMVRLTEPFDASLANRADEDIIEEARENARRDSNALEEGRVDADEMSGFMTFMYQRGRQNGSLREQQRLAVFFRDLTRELRRDPGGG